MGNPNGRVLAIEDVTTTAGSALRFIDEAISPLEDSELIGVIGLTNRLAVYDGRTVEERMREASVPYWAMSKSDQLLPRAYQKIRPSDEIADAVEREFKHYHNIELNLRGN